MRLVTVRTAEGPRACVERGGRYVDVRAADPSLPSSVKEILALGMGGGARVEAAAAKGGVSHDPASAELLAPVPDPQKILCLGLNYRDHAEESGMAIPEEPVLFSKFPSALVGPATIELPAASTQVDFEAELVWVIGRRGRDIPRERAMDYIGGYTIGHDVSARDWQLHKPGKQWMAGKTFDTFAPTGPAVVTPDEVPDLADLGIRPALNCQRAVRIPNTKQPDFSCREGTRYVNCHPRAGDLISRHPSTAGRVVGAEAGSAEGR